MPKAVHKVPAKDFKIILGREPEHYYTNMVRRFLIHEQDMNEKSYKWNGNLSPSGFSANDCMETYMRGVDRYLRFKENILLRVKMGLVIHDGLSRLEKRIPGLLFDKPPARDAEHAQQIDRYWPEIKIFYEMYGVSTKPDNILRIQGKPVLIDKKTTWLDLHGPSAGPKPQLSHWTQVCSGIFCVNGLNIYPDVKIERGGVVYIDCRQQPFTYDWSVEKYFDYTSAVEEMMEIMFEHRVWHRNGKLKGKTRKCEYPYCPTHGTHDALEVLCESTKIPYDEYKRIERESAKWWRNQRKTRPKEFRVVNKFLRGVHTKLNGDEGK